MTGHAKPAKAPASRRISRRCLLTGAGRPRRHDSNRLTVRSPCAAGRRCSAPPQAASAAAHLLLDDLADHLLHCWCHGRRVSAAICVEERRSEAPPRGVHGLRGDAGGAPGSITLSTRRLGVAAVAGSERFARTVGGGDFFSCQELPCRKHLRTRRRLSVVAFTPIEVVEEGGQLRTHQDDREAANSQRTRSERIVAGAPNRPAGVHGGGFKPNRGLSFACVSEAVHAFARLRGNCQFSSPSCF